jgi:hypothetical protein
LPFALETFKENFKQLESWKKTCMYMQIEFDLRNGFCFKQKLVKEVSYQARKKVRQNMCEGRSV